MSKQSAGLALARNVQRLMDHHELSQAKLAQASGVAQSTLSRLLDTANPAGINPRASTIDLLAKYFRVPAWQLQIPDLPLELLVSTELTSLLEHYRDVPPDAREAIARVAENEARYAVVSERRKTGS